MARPPRRRAATNSPRWRGTAAPIADKAKRRAETIRMRLRPKRSVSQPANAAPIAQPTRRLDVATSVPRVERPRSWRRKSRAPLMTAVSNPKSRPETAATAAIR